MVRRPTRARNINRIRNKLDSQIKNEKKLLTDTFNGTTIGIVMNTDDPQQMGRLQVFCTSFGDQVDLVVEDLPWAIYGTSFGGHTSYGNRGNDSNVVEGTTSYGIWAIPKIGSQVLVQCIDGNPDYRVWVGSVYGQLLTHTLPNGRYTKEDLEGPFASNETKIQPLYDNILEAFGVKDGNHELRTRGIDSQVGAVDNIHIEETSSVKADIDTGYTQNRQLPEYDLKDSNIYSMTSPGLHSMVLDDSEDNCRVKFRTTSGHQIILDDTNERIYISTAKGNNWIEMDQAGNIDMYTSGKFSVHAENDINFTSDKSIKMYAKEGIHLNSEEAIKLQANSSINLKANTKLNLNSGEDLNIHSNVNFKLQVDGKTDILSEGVLKITTNSTMYLRSSFNTFINGAQVFLNSGASGNTVTPFSALFVESAFIPSKIPEHEPWARIATSETFPSNEGMYTTNYVLGLGTKISTTILELDYNDSNVGRLERGINISRGPNWKR